MAKGLVTDTYLSDIADAIRSKLGTQDTYTPPEMAAAILSIPTGGLTIVDFSTGTDDEVAAMIDAAQNGDINLQTDGGWSVGDTRTIAIGAYQNDEGTTQAAHNAVIAITSFDEYESCGNVLQFDFLTRAGEARMNSSGSNSGGYDSSLMKTTTIPNLVNALPTWLKDRLLQFGVVTNKGTSPSIGKLALRSADEVYNSGSKLLPYYTTAANRLKYDTDGGNVVQYWFRGTVGTTEFEHSDRNGSSTYSSNATRNLAIIPFGCL